MRPCNLKSPRGWKQVLSSTCGVWTYCQMSVSHMSERSPKTSLKKFRKPDVATEPLNDTTCPRGHRALLPNGNLWCIYLFFAAEQSCKQHICLGVGAVTEGHIQVRKWQSVQSEGWYYVSFAGLYHDYRMVIHVDSSNTSKSPQTNMLENCPPLALVSQG